MAIKRIFSAGGIVLRQAQDKLFKKPVWEVLLTQHSKHKGWDFPKGHIEKGESAEIAAIREVEEETGVKAQVLEKVGATEYFYYDSGPHFAPDGATRSKEKILKTVVYFLMNYVGEGEATTSWEVSEMVWLKPEDVEGKLTFKDTKELWKKVREKVVNGIYLKIS